MRNLLLGMLLATCSLTATSPTLADETVTEGRTWLYGNVTGVFHPNWAATVMPGIRYEFSDSVADASGVAMYELFAGPMFMTRLGPVRFRLPIWYYYMGFPIKDKDDYFSSHNIELIPIFSYGRGNWSFHSRTIFHNKVYADNSAFVTDSQRRGHSLLLRQLFKVAFRARRGWSVHLANEVFIGLKEDGETRGIAKGEPFFEKEGFSMNRVYAGTAFVIAPRLSVMPQYVLETHHNPDESGDLTRVRHYLFVTLSYVIHLL